MWSFGYFVDTVVGDTPSAIRVFSQTKDISTFELVSGEFPTKSNEVALAQTMADQYKIGDTIRLNESGSSTLLKEHEFYDYRFCEFQRDSFEDD